MQRLTAFILSGVPALLPQRLRADLETVCPSVLSVLLLSEPHLCPPVTLSSHRAHLHPRVHRDEPCKSPPRSVSLSWTAIIVLARVRHKHLTKEWTHFTPKDFLFPIAITICDVGSWPLSKCSYSGRIRDNEKFRTSPFSIVSLNLHLRNLAVSNPCHCVHPSSLLLDIKKWQHQLHCMTILFHFTGVLSASLSLSPGRVMLKLPTTTQDPKACQWAQYNAIHPTMKYLWSRQWCRETLSFKQPHESSCIQRMGLKVRILLQNNHKSTFLKPSLLRECFALSHSLLSGNNVNYINARREKCSNSEPTSKWLTEGLNFLWVCSARLLFICFYFVSFVYLFFIFCVNW